MFLPFNEKLHLAKFLERDNRFILTCELVDSKERIKVHLQDPGRLKELLIPNNQLYVSYHDTPNRKTKWTAELMRKPESDVLVSLRSTLPNYLIKSALLSGHMAEFNHLKFSRQEYTHGDSRWDFLLKGEGFSYLLEVKSVTMEKGGVGYFPDAPTKRGKKHVEELTFIQQKGEYQTGILFVCQREDIKMVRPAEWIDPLFTDALKKAKAQGVEINARVCTLSLEGITLGLSVPVRL